MQLLNHCSQNSGVAVVFSFLSRVGAAVIINCVHARNARSMACTCQNSVRGGRNAQLLVPTRALWACSRPSHGWYLKNKDLDGLIVDISLSRSMWNVLYCKLMSHVEAASIYIHIYTFVCLFVCFVPVALSVYIFTHTHTTLK